MCASYLQYEKAPKWMTLRLGGAQKHLSAVYANAYSLMARTELFSSKSTWYKLEQYKKQPCSTVFKALLIFTERRVSLVKKHSSHIDSALSGSTNVLADGEPDTISPIPLSNVVSDTVT